MIIDFHTHIYPCKIAAKASKAIGDFYDAPMMYNGLVEELLESGRKIGVDRYVVHSAASTPTQVESINNFIASQVQEHTEFLGYGTMHPAYENFEAELDRLMSLGLKGVKFHCDFQKFQADCPEMDGIYDACAARGLPVIFHAGDSRYDFSGPARIAHVLDKHPDLTVIAAHFGGYTEWDKAMELLAGRNVYFDTSSTLWKLPVEKADAMIKRHGYQKILFGSDFPMWDHAQELERFNQLNLTSAEREAVLGGNAARLLGLA